jgi:L-iditol 2-dehydrogenase
LAGARAVIVSQRSAGRRAHAERLGATATVDPTTEDLAALTHEVSRGVGIDTTIICIGVPELVNTAFRVARPGGRINVFAGLKGEGWAQVEANLIHYKQLVVSGSSDVRRSDYRTALELIESGRIDTASMVTHRFPLSAVDEALDAVTSGEAIKVAVLPALHEENP